MKKDESVNNAQCQSIKLQNLLDQSQLYYRVLIQRDEKATQLQENHVQA